MKKYIAAVLAIFISFCFVDAVAGTRLSAIASGGQVASTDQVVAVRSGTTDVLVNPTPCADTQVPYNLAGAWGCDSAFKYDYSTQTLDTPNADFGSGAWLFNSNGTVFSTYFQIDNSGNWTLVGGYLGTYIDLQTGGLNNAGFINIPIGGSMLIQDGFGILRATINDSGVTASTLAVEGGITSTMLGANAAVLTDANKNLYTSTTTATQIGYLSTLASDVQTQLNTKVTDPTLLNGDIPTRLGGVLSRTVRNGTATRMFLQQTGNGGGSFVSGGWVQPNFTDFLGNATAAQGGTGRTTLTANSVLLGEGTGNVAFATIGTAGRILFDKGAAADPAFAAMSQDCTITSAGVITCTKTNNVAFGAAATLGVGTGLASSGGNINSNAVYQMSFQPGLITSITNTKGVFGKVSKAATVDNIEGSSITFSCVGNPTVTMYECGTDAACATSPVTIGSVTITASGQAFDGTVSNAAITAGDYVAFAISSGTCASLDASATAQVHSN